MVEQGQVPGIHLFNYVGVLCFCMCMHICVEVDEYEIGRWGFWLYTPHICRIINMYPTHVSVFLPTYTHRLDRLFLDIPNQAMADLGVHKIGQEENIEEHPLDDHHGRTEEETRLLEL